jgi:hypothetical protein
MQNSLVDAGAHDRSCALYGFTGVQHRHHVRQRVPQQEATRQAQLDFSSDADLRVPHGTRFFLRATISSLAPEGAHGLRPQMSTRR